MAETQQPRSTPPTVEEYKDALGQIAGLLTPNQKALLRAHYCAREHTVTTEQLARAVGSPGSQGVELQYGRVVYSLQKVLGWQGCDWTENVIGTWIRSGDPAEWVYVMRPELVAALRCRRWIRLHGRGARRTRR
jgi:hypothetical protein